MPVLGGAEEPVLTLAFVGDGMLGRGVAQALGGDWEAAFTRVWPWLAEADLTFANLESPLTTAPLVPVSVLGRLGSLPHPSGLNGTEVRVYDLRAPPEAVVALGGAGFDVVSLANNHALDAGNPGLRQTVSTLQAAGVAPLVDWETDTLVVGSCHHCTSFPLYQSTNLSVYRMLAFDDSVAPLDLEGAVEAVAAAAEQADVVVVSVHWGGEYQAAPGPRQQAVARALAGVGARLIVGHGPHVLQRVEWVGETLVAYSLGNFLFDQPYPADCRWGAILRVMLRGDRIVAVEAVPTVVEHGSVRPADPEDAVTILARLNLKP